VPQSAPNRSSTTRPFGPRPLAPASLPPGQPAAISYTSGNTGRPEGIANNEAALFRRVEQYVDAAHLNATDRFLTLSSPCTIAGTREGWRHS
jgi:acyl-coenzyme A synthetase/AMP-(fatty) acid ligase